MLFPWSASKDFPSHLEYNSRSLPQSQGPASSGSRLPLGPPPASSSLPLLTLATLTSRMCLNKSVLFHLWTFCLLGRASSCLTSSLGWLLLLNWGLSARVISARLLQPREGIVHEQSESIFYPMVSSSLKQVPDALQVMQ